MSAWAEKRALLVVASSGRALAASAARGGLPVVVLDLYNDLDTRDLALASRAVASRSGHFDSRRLLAAAAELCPVQRCVGLICGSGFEARTGLLKKLAEGRTLFGNGPGTVAMVKDPARFFPLLDGLGIAHPAVTLEAPCDPEGWLVKRVGAAGGSHVRRAGKRHRARAHRYFQRLASGRVFSALFAADGARARVLGFNEQWTAGVPWCAPYCYGGAVTCNDLPQGIATRIAHALDGLVAATGLVGVNGVDFILDGDTPLMLEINPRPTATIDLCDADLEAGVIELHLRACRGELPAAPVVRRIRAHAIVYAATSFRVPARLSWPAWCTDLPEAGSLIPGGAPVCSVHCEADTARQARLLVQTRREQIEATLWARAA